jgi:hypothetical protein
VSATAVLKALTAPISRLFHPYSLKILGWLLLCRCPVLVAVDEADAFDSPTSFAFDGQPYVCRMFRRVLHVYHLWPRVW